MYVMKKSGLIFIFLVVFFAAIFSNATTGKKDETPDLNARVDALFSEWDRPDMPGTAVIIIKNGKVVHQKGCGSANLEYGIPITSKTIFDVGVINSYIYKKWRIIWVKNLNFKTSRYKAL